MRITTAAELEQMTPAERLAHFDASIVWEPDSSDDPRLRELTDQLRLEMLDQIEASEGIDARRAAEQSLQEPQTAT